MNRVTILIETFLFDAIRLVPHGYFTEDNVVVDCEECIPDSLPIIVARYCFIGGISSTDTPFSDLTRSFAFLSRGRETSSNCN